MVCARGERLHEKNCDLKERKVSCFPNILSVSKFVSGGKGSVYVEVGVRKSLRTTSYIMGASHITDSHLPRRVGRRQLFLDSDDTDAKLHTCDVNGTPSWRAPEPSSQCSDIVTPVVQLLSHFCHNGKYHTVVTLTLLKHCCYTVVTLLMGHPGGRHLLNTSSRDHAITIDTTVIISHPSDYDLYSVTL